MPFEITCPSCHVRLNVQDDAGNAPLICPRCLGEVPDPRGVASPAAASTAPETSFRAEAWRAVPTVAAEAKGVVGKTYFVILAVAVLAIIGSVVEFGREVRAQRRGLVGFTNAESWLCPLVFLEIVLTILVVYPIGRRLLRSHSTTDGSALGDTARAFAFVSLILVLAPVAFMVIFLSVCAVCATVSQ